MECKVCFCVGYRSRKELVDTGRDAGLLCLSEKTQLNVEFRSMLQ